jgi:hypothetical protein
MLEVLCWTSRRCLSFVSERLKSPLLLSLFAFDGFVLVPLPGQWQLPGGRAAHDGERRRSRRPRAQVSCRLTFCFHRSLRSGSLPGGAGVDDRKIDGMLGSPGFPPRGDVEVAAYGKEVPSNIVGALVCAEQSSAGICKLMREGCGDDHGSGGLVHPD